MSDQMTVIGMMSGTSLDGVDLACCHFHFTDKWQYKIQATQCVHYPVSWSNKLSQAFHYNAQQLKALDLEYGAYLGELLLQFIAKNKLKPHLIASHGHTIFHMPEKGFTLQVGNGHVIAKATGLPVVNNFRQADINNGGQGAPLVPVGDKMLFGDYQICLNIGGIANVSYEQYGERIAFDIGPANQVLNFLARELGLTYDTNGEMARSGKLEPTLLASMNKLEYFSLKKPKSLGREWIESVFLPVLNRYNTSIENKLNTVCQHIALQVRIATDPCPISKMLVTGGGAFNTFLMECIRSNSKHEVIVPGIELIDFKEAIVFAFLGMLRQKGQINCLASVTGASCDSSLGDMCLP